MMARPFQQQDTGKGSPFCSRANEYCTHASASRSQYVIAVSNNPYIADSTPPRMQWPGSARLHPEMGSKWDKPMTNAAMQIFIINNSEGKQSSEHAVL